MINKLTLIQYKKKSLIICNLLINYYKIKYKKNVCINVNFGFKYFCFPFYYDFYCCRVCFICDIKNNNNLLKVQI